LSLIALRRLRFPLNGNDKADAAVNVTARALLAALGLCSASLAFGAGMGLRSRCVLFPEAPMTWDLLDVPGQKPKQFTLDRDTAIALLNEAAAAAKKVELPWNTQPIELTPSKELVKLVKQSQELATRESDSD